MITPIAFHPGRHDRVRLRAGAIAIGILAAAFPGTALASPSWPAIDSIPWPDGTEALAFENLDGVILLRARVTGTGGRDTSGTLVLDTGAGYLVLDEPLAAWAGVSQAGARSHAVGLATRPLPRLAVGSLTMDQVDPVLTFDADLIRRVTDRPVMGLLGHRPLQDRALWIDYRVGHLALVPAGPAPGLGVVAELDSSRKLVARLLSPRAIPTRFRLVGDGKVLLRVRIIPRSGRIAPWLTFALDTGASKCVLFEGAADSLAQAATWKPALSGLIAPTLFGESPARLVRAARVEVGGSGVLEGSPTNGSGQGGVVKGTGAAGHPRIRVLTAAQGVDVVILDSPLAHDLARVAGEPVHGLLGYSFLKQFRIVCDYPHRVLWLDPVPGYRDDRPYEHSHVGVQLERRHGVVRVVGVAEGSPAGRAGIRAGDEITAVDGRYATGLGVLELSRLMEGPPGTRISVSVRRGDREATFRLRRQRLL